MTLSYHSNNKVKYLVVDSGAIIAGSRLENVAEEFYTIAEVLGEIRDEKSRIALANLPFDLKTRVPSDEAIAFGAVYVCRYFISHTIKNHTFS